MLFGAFFCCVATFAEEEAIETIDINDEYSRITCVVKKFALVGLGFIKARFISRADFVAVSQHEQLP